MTSQPPGLDPIAADSIDQLISLVVETLHVTSVAVTHDMRSARHISRRILMLHEGRIYADRTPDEIFKSNDPVDPPICQRHCRTDWKTLTCMNDSRFEMKVGLFVFIGLAVMALLVLNFSKGIDSL